MKICAYLCGVLSLIFSLNTSALVSETGVLLTVAGKTAEKLLEPSKTCAQEEWTQEDGRTQGGGWVWFPGKSSHSNLSIATLQAEGQALEYLKGECQRIPSSTQFNEKCVERSNGKFKVYVRAAIRDRSCKSGNDINKELTKRHISYKSSQIQQTLNSSVCHRGNAIGCYQLADKEWRVKNMARAMAYAESACTFGDSYSCGFLGFMHYQLSNAAEARAYLEIGCNESGAKVWCDSLSDLTKQLKKT